MTYKPSATSLTIIGAYAVNTIFTFLSNTGLYGCTNAGQSDKYMTPITPPGWAFAIWGVIFIWEAVACIAALLPSQQKSPIPTNKWFVYSWIAVCVLQAAWSVAFCQSVFVSSALLFAVFFALLAMQLSSMATLKSNYFGPSTSSFKDGVMAYLIYIAPFSLHLGWVTAATTLNFVIAFVAHLSSEVTLLTVSVLSVVFVMMIAMWISILNRDVVHGAGVMWALNAVSHHDQALKVTTVDGPTTISSIAANTLASTTYSGTYLVGILILASYAVWLIQRFLCPSCSGTDRSAQVPQDPNGVDAKLLESTPIQETA